MHDWASFIRDIPDFPKPGILFKDITPLLADAEGLAGSMRALAEPWREHAIDVICAIEARGFILGMALARELGTGFVPLRKAGKLPGGKIGVDYQLEYGMDRLEAHVDALQPGVRALIVDDVLATGGTLGAARQLVEQLGASVVGGCVLIELDALQGRPRWGHDAPLHSLLHY